MTELNRPKLSIWQIWNMSFGFLGIQYGFGLQQANLSPIFRYLGAAEHELPILWLAGPITGLLIQPIVGALSDGTWTRFGRRRPFFLIGALIGSIAVLFMPYAPYLWIAVGLFWILDAAMNTAMEPYRALVADNLPVKQQSLGFSVQTIMIAVGQILAGLMPMILLFFGVSSETDGKRVPDIIKISFVIGVAAILISALWTAWTTEEHPPEDMEAFRKRTSGSNTVARVYRDLRDAIRDMPLELRQIWWVKLFSWFAMPLMWQYLALSIARHCFNAPTPESPGFAEGSAMVGTALTVMNLTTLGVAFMVPRLVDTFGSVKIYSIFLFFGGLGFVSMLFVDSLPFIYLCMVLVGIGWSAIVSIPFIITAAVVPRERVGIYMGLLNAFICIPQIISMLVIYMIYEPLLGGDPRNALVLAGVCLWLASFAALRIGHQNSVQEA